MRWQDVKTYQHWSLRKVRETQRKPKSLLRSAYAALKEKDIEARGAGTAEVVELDVKVKVPVIGGKLEGLMADNIKAGLEVEQTIGAAWLGGER